MDYIRLGQTRLEKSRMYLAGTTYRNLEKDAHVLMSSDRKLVAGILLTQIPSQGLVADFGSEKQTAPS